MAERRRKFWGWGYEDEQAPAAEVEHAGRAAREHLGFGPAEVEPPPRLEDVELPPARIRPPASLAGICRSDPYERASHAYGKAYRDLVRAFRGRFDHPPDVVAHPRDEREVEELLDWCAEVRAAAIPFGGGTSVVGGVEARVPHEAVVTIDLKRMNRVLDVDPLSRAARIQAGATGPGLEEQLKRDGMTLRHYPQSFELSTLGGWIATRAGGHFATLHTHIDDFVESVRAITPSGAWESRRLPGSGAGPSPDRLLIGSEGILGVITEAWVRVHERPAFKESAAVLFEGFEQGAVAVRALAQSRLFPSNCRLLDPGEAALTNAAPGGRALLVLGFEGPIPVGGPMAQALELCRDHGGEPGERRGEPEDRWRDAFLRAPYLRDTLVAAGVVAETFESAVTWDRFESFVRAVRERTEAALPGEARVTCRLTHVYPDGVAPYFTVLAPARRGAELEQWDEVKEAASDAIAAAGGTITHHHAVGRDHRPWYDRQRPGPFAEALRAAKAAVDPAGIPQPRGPDRPHHPLSRGHSGGQTPRRRELSRADRVRPGLWRLRLPLPWPGVPHVNAFAIAAVDGVVLVDTGLHEPGAMLQLERALYQAGLRVEHVRLLVCTHAHSDHYGLAAPIMERSGCELWMHPNHEHMTKAARDPARDFERRLEVARQSGVPPAALADYESARRGRGWGIAHIVMPGRDLVEGVEVDTDLGPWRVHETPGHAPSHVVLHQPERGLLLSGDHLLGRVSLYYDYGYTPDPAGEFLRSLDVVDALDVKLVLAGHGRPVRDARALTEANRRAVGAKLDRIRSAIAAAPRTPFDLVPEVIETELPPAMMVGWGLSETLTYLNHLERRGEAARVDAEPERWAMSG